MHPETSDRAFPGKSGDGSGIRLLVLADGFAPLVGGVEVLFRHLCTRLARRGVVIHVVADRVHAHLAERERRDGYDIARLPFRDAVEARDADRIHRVARRLGTLCNAFRPDIVHVVAPSIALFFYLRAAVDPAASFLLALHSTLPTADEASMPLLARAFTRADRITAPTRALLADALAHFPDTAGRAEVVYNGLPERASPRPMPDGPPRLFCVGRMVPEKGFDVAVDAFRLVHHAVPDARLTLIGDGPERPALEARVAALGLAGAVAFAGVVTPDEMPRRYDEATLVMMPSRWREPFGLVALEAAQAGRPVVAAAVGGLPEVVADGRSGLLVPPDDPAAMAAAVLTLIGDSPRASAMGRAGANIARERFGLKRFVDDHMRLYSSLLSPMETPA